ncbi:Ig-like domain-containing protein [Planococcus plakortidis]|uniref:Ig-like domain-containing protein n=1 Tax=Planococcus plakortidis TaxID=1038856 RepID=UPI0038594985
MKRAIIFTVFLMMFQLVSGMVPVFAEGDTTPPIIKSMKVSTKEAKVGETIKFSADVEDNFSGVKYVFVYFNSPTGNRSLNLSLSYNPESGFYEATHEVIEADEGGLWELNFISVQDMVSNKKNYSPYEIDNLNSNIDFTILNENGDTTPPAIKSMKVSTKEAEVGETITFSADVEDDFAGVKYVFVYFDSPSGNRSLNLSLSYNPESGLYEATHEVIEADEGGLWELNFISVQDMVSNKKNYSPYEIDNLNSNIDFTILNKNGDTTPPAIKSMKVSTKEAKVGETITFSADMEDDFAGVKYVFVYFDSPSGNRSLNLSLSYNPESGLYEATHEVIEADEVGLWKLNFISVQDMVSNKKSYSPYEINNIDSNIDFIIHHGVSDLENPSINDPALPYAVTTKNEAWINKTIDKDLYIGPNSTITIADDVTITGNVYVYGTLITHGGLSIGGTLNAKTVTYGSTSYAAPGAVRVVGGVNSIRSTSVSNQTYPVPFNIHSENLTNDMDTAVIEGKTLPFLDVTMQGNPVSLEADGSFTATADPVTSDGISFNMRDVFGNNMKKEIPVADVVAPAEVQNFSVSKTTATELQVSWGANSEQDLNGYELYLKGEFVETVSADTLNYTFNGLEEGTKYEIAIAAADFNDNVGETVTANGTTLLSKPVVEPISDKTTSIIGQAAVGTTILITAGEEEIASGKVSSDGKFAIEIPAQPAGTKLSVSASNETGMISEKTIITVEDKTAPAAPTVGTVSDKDTVITGTAEAGAAIAIKLGNNTIGEGSADESGNYSVAIPKQQAGDKLMITATDAAGNASEAVIISVVDMTAPTAPTVEEVTDKMVTVKGTAEAGSSISVKQGSAEIGTAIADAQGYYGASIAKQTAGTELNVTATDKAGNVSEAAKATVLDGTAPSAPSVEEVTDKSTTVSGTAEAGSTVSVKIGLEELAKTTADQDGNFEVSIAKQTARTKLIITATDDAGNTSEATALTVSDITAPDIPSVNPVTHKSTEMTGSAEALSEVSVMKDSKVIASGIATEEGTYRITIDPQPVDVKLEVYVTDQAGNVSGKASVLVEKAAPEETTRISGTSRYGTAIAISQEGWETADTVVLATAGDFPDALAGGPLAFQENAPILLTRTGNLTDETKAEIERLGAEKMIILGSKGAVSLEVEEEVKQMGIATERIGGRNRFDTAALIADRLDSEEAIIAYGFNFPDVLSVSAYAAKNGIPILLTRTDKLPAETAVALETASKTHVIGSTGAVGETVFTALPNPIRYGGKSRYDTGFEVNNKLKMGTEKAFIATGLNFPDALAGSVLAAKYDAPILLVKEHVIPDATAEQLDAYDTYSIFGGTGAVGESVREQLDQQLKN